MSQKHTAVELQDPTGNQVRAVSQENDFPLPPVDELKKLHDFRPDLVDKIIDLTAQEAAERHKRAAQIDRYIHWQNLVSSVGAILVALLAFSGAIFLAYCGHDWTAIGIVGTTLGVVVYAITKSVR